MLKNSQTKKFTLRVYGIWIKDDHILLSKEQINDFAFTQFPGGGVEPGEGVLDALKREWIEETGVIITEHQHVYTTDFFQVSAFNPKEQLISIYYQVDCLAEPLFYEKDESTSKEIKRLELIWHPLSDFNPDLLTFPDDKEVSKMISGSDRLWDGSTQH